MLTTVYSVCFLLLCLALGIASFSRPRLGLYFLVGVTPFYSILREASAGSPAFFLWPYLLTAALVAAIAVHELTGLLAARGVERPGRLVVRWAAGVAVAMLVVEELMIGALGAALVDSDLSSVSRLVGNGPLATVTIVSVAGVLLFSWLFLGAMHRREGRVEPLDVVVVAFVLWGVIQIGNTYARNGLLFTGLNGFRYSYFAAMTYFPARYLLRDEADRRRLLRLLVTVSVLAAAELYGESVFLNVFAFEPNQLPWASGHLSSEFGYTPDTERAFFDGRYIPLGFMYQTHLSGLFVLLGFALWLPRALVARGRGHLIALSVALLFLMVNSLWTSRTVLLLGVGAAVLAVAMSGVAWRRAAAALVAMAVAAPIASTFLIPGVRYDLFGEIGFLTGRAIPSLARAIGRDLEQVVGWNPMPALARIADYTPSWRRPPEGWRLTSGGLRYSDAVVLDHATSVALYPAATGAELRFELGGVEPFAGRTLTAEAWVWAEDEKQARVQLHDGTKGRLSAYHAGSEDWQQLSISLDIDPDAMQLVVDIDVEGQAEVYVDSVTLRADGPAVPLFGWEMPPDIATLADGLEHGLAMGAPGPEDASGAAESPLDPTGLPGPPSAESPVAADIFLAPEAAPVAPAAADPSPAPSAPAPAAAPVAPAAADPSPAPSAPVPAAALVDPPVPPPAPAPIPDASSADAADAPPDDVPVTLAPEPERPSPVWMTLLGRGATYGDWNIVFFGDSGEERAFRMASYSDMKVLEFGEQFGVPGALLLVLTGGLGLWVGFPLSRRATDPSVRARYVGALLVVFVGYGALVHLPSLFRIGTGTAVYATLGVLASAAAARRARRVETADE